MRATAALCALALAGLPQALPAQAVTQPPAQGFSPPAAGSYTLPVIQRAADGWVLEGNLVPRRLAGYTHGAVTLLSFVYTYCADPLGCPLAYATFDTVKRGVLADPSLRGKVRLVSLSFDPQNDTPDAMRTYGGEHAKDRTVPWHFLTTYSMRWLTPILDDFGQDVEVDRDARGTPTRARTHMLKVFLLDLRGQVREIYGVAFLLPEVILNDMRTLILEGPPRMPGQSMRDSR